MNIRRTPAKRVEENDVHEEVPPQVKKVEKVIDSILWVKVMRFRWFP